MRSSSVTTDRMYSSIVIFYLALAKKMVLKVAKEFDSIIVEPSKENQLKR